MFGNKLSKLRRYSTDTLFIHLNLKAQKASKDSRGEIVHSANIAEADRLCAAFVNTLDANVAFFGRYTLTYNNWESTDIYIPLDAFQKAISINPSLLDRFMDKGLVTDTRILRGLEGHIHGELVNMPKKLTTIRIARYKASIKNPIKLYWPSGHIPSVHQLRAKKGE